jgi:hypothetical protein
MRHTASTEVIKPLLEVCMEEDVKEKEKWDMTPLHLGLMNKVPAEEINLVVDAYPADVNATYSAALRDGTTHQLR